MSKKKFTPSRIGKQPIAIPKGVDVKINGNVVTVKGPKGTLSREFQDVEITSDGKRIVVAPVVQTNLAKAMHGLGRALLNNMVTGVSTGYKRELEVQGVGYRIAQSGQTLTFSVGFSHEVKYEVPKGVTAKVTAQTKLSLEGINKEELGQVAASIRGIRPPEPYKGKGIRYAGEHVRRKAGKAAGK